MRCPKCNDGELRLYKEVDKASVFKITKDNKIYKRPFSVREFETEKNYLECGNMGCNQSYNYELDDVGKIISVSKFEL